ncbi:NupC/NupG family nucleoside CNT transporter [Macrococcoides bohemicum]|uniref:NupC/NupG family nucleoside CNT transporter n=1 Tax=Macrococcoides bohemicum TaxID=1903056 RepID=A0A4R5XRJ0_9STAP|nr:MULTISPECIES: nucleoside transporter C-terminal domain-containing protein [Macrococcus]ATD31400.1 nucleoside permease [Macrococcus sp. IME1552]QRN48861.1 NupC/NupG family nucleoside CNT transporter [Macrococcus bohemicus]QYA42616.1 NupC/NupG family nucleoside CNT transporter [Macrococcus bohemicus]QYA44998.1 NupC/NupG family nucleoside CNT transporter [Macrococcus bohemicus]TDL33307.1 NupC/NupG family nucleoside CNT transporter [Macrococcus bohemicus]
MNTYLLLNVLGIFVFILVAFVFSRDKKNIDWKSVVIMLVVNLFLAWFFTQFPWGRNGVKAVADAFSWMLQAAYVGIGMPFGSWTAPGPGKMDMAVSALLPILFVVPLFDILMYIGVLPFIIKWFGWLIGKVTGQPKFESFYSVEMMVLGNTEALAVSKEQVSHMNAARVLTVALMSMSCISGSIVGAYVTMVPGELVLTAIPLNIINAIIIATILNPVKLTPEEDYVVEIKHDNRQPFFSFLGDSVLGAGKLILIIIAFLIAFVSLAHFIDMLLGLINKDLKLDLILGWVMAPFALLLGLPWDQAITVGAHMAKKIITNEFVVMIDIQKSLPKMDNHMKAVLVTFLISFANFSTVGMIIGALKGIVDVKTSDFIAKYVPMMLLAGILVSLLSAAFVGLFSW